MREIVSDIDRWRQNGEPIALATVVSTWGSAPRGVGAKMALTPSGRISGSVSGGCVEGAVFSAGTDAIEADETNLLSFGVADETAWDVGLACGGQIEVFVEPLDLKSFDMAKGWLDSERSGVIITVIGGPDEYLGRKLLVSADEEQYGEIAAGLDPEITGSIAAESLEGGRSMRRRVTHEELSLELFVDAILPQPTLILVGGAHIAVALTAIASAVGFRTIVIDPRRAFGSEERFPHVDRLIQAWPEEAFSELKVTSSTAVAMLSHDPKIDDPALKVVLPGPAFYVGALGSSSTHAKRVKRLLDAGVAPELVRRIHSPIGLHIQAQTPEEIAVAVMAEIVAAKHKAG